MLHPRLPTYPFIITEVPTDKHAFISFLTLLGDRHAWSNTAINDFINNSRAPRDLVLSIKKDTFLRTRYNPGSITHKAITAKEITTMLMPIIYKRK